MSAVQPEFDLGNTEGRATAGAALRDAGAERGLSSHQATYEAAVGLVKKYLAAVPFTGEDVRELCLRNNVGNALHPNGWGAIILRMKRGGMLDETGVWRSPRDKRSHARPTREYRLN